MPRKRKATRPFRQKPRRDRPPALAASEMTVEQLADERLWHESFRPNSDDEWWWSFARSGDISHELSQRFVAHRNATPNITDGELRRWAALMGKDEGFVRHQRYCLDRKPRAGKVLAMPGGSDAA